jgi:outer membrane biosynthesis protein TonB
LQNELSQESTKDTVPETIEKRQRVNDLSTYTYQLAPKMADSSSSADPAPTSPPQAAASSSTQSQTPTCAACSKTPDSPKQCTKCHSVTYCNKDCQKAHFKAHKKVHTACFLSRILLFLTHIAMSYPRARIREAPRAKNGIQIRRISERRAAEGFAKVAGKSRISSFS